MVALAVRFPVMLILVVVEWVVLTHSVVGGVVAVILITAVMVLQIPGRAVVVVHLYQ